MDSAGDQHLHIDHNIFKRRMDLEGNPIDVAKKEEIITSTTKKEKNNSVCFNFYRRSEKLFSSLHF